MNFCIRRNCNKCIWWNQYSSYKCIRNPGGAEINITGSTIIAEDTGVTNENDGTVNRNNPVIISDNPAKVGIYLADNTTFKFYDGIIKRVSTTPIAEGSNITYDFPDNYSKVNGAETINNQTYYTVYLQSN